MRHKHIPEKHSLWWILGLRASNCNSLMQLTDFILWQPKVFFFFAYFIFDPSTERNVCVFVQGQHFVFTLCGLKIGFSGLHLNRHHLRYDSKVCDFVDNETSRWVSKREKSHNFLRKSYNLSLICRRRCGRPKAFRISVEFMVHNLPFLHSLASIRTLVALFHRKNIQTFYRSTTFCANFSFFFCVCVVFKVENHVCVCYLDIDFRHSNKQILFILPRQIYFFFNILFVVVHFSLKCTPIGFHRNDINKFHACRARHKDERKLSQRRNHLNNILNKTFSFQFFRSVVSRRRWKRIWRWQHFYRTLESMRLKCAPNEQEREKSEWQQYTPMTTKTDEKKNEKFPHENKSCRKQGERKKRPHRTTC